MNKYDLSIIIPVYNEEEAIIKVINNIRNDLANKNINYEIIIVNDGSTDKTCELLENTKIENLKIINLPYNKGYGAALKTGIIKAESENICIIDADDTYPTNMIYELYKDINKYDMIVGSRTGEKVSIPNLRRPAKWFIGVLANYLAGTKIPDLNSGLRIFKKRLALTYFNILPSGFSFTTTITLAAYSGDYFIKYIPINYYKRKGKSKIKPVRHTMEFTLLVFRIIMYFKPLKIFIPISSIIFIIGLYRTIYTIITRSMIHEFSVLTILLSVLIFLIGLFADMIVKTRNTAINTN
ncbi:MAG TPA: glycosyltransferase family 2 protein [bacterium]|nr:glycosyltransferase family 2 protein [bacterium]HPQ19489.1 glycosyltransferase family 2 protein [bacterium]